MGKKLYLIVLLIIICIFAASCLQKIEPLNPGSNSGSETERTTATDESKTSDSINPSTDSTSAFESEEQTMSRVLELKDKHNDYEKETIASLVILQNRDISGYPVDHPYPEELNDLSLLHELTGDSDAYKNAVNEINDSLRNNPELEENLLPVLYRAIRKTGISKDEFVAKNEDHKNQMQIFTDQGSSAALSVYDDKQIEYLFGDYSAEEIMENLKADWTFYYDGRLYTMNNLINIASFDRILEFYEKGDHDNFLARISEIVEEESIFEGEAFFEFYYEEDDQGSIIAEASPCSISEFRSVYEK